MSKPEPLVRIDQLEFTDGTTVDTSESDVVVLVGPNNSGKSRTLIEAHQLLSRHVGQSYVESSFALRDLKLHYADVSKLDDWLRSNRPVVQDPNGAERVLLPVESSLTLGRSVADAQEDRMGQGLTPALTRVFNTDGRLRAVSEESTAERTSPGAPLRSSLHRLLADSQRLDKLTSLFKRAFGFNLLVDSWGPQVRLRTSIEYRQEDLTRTTSTGAMPADLEEVLAKCPNLEFNSDGVKSFSALLISLVASDYPLVLIDEPEAFLHPPQARLLGSELARLPSGAQMFVATHSSDLIRGLLDSPSEARVTIIRLERSAGGVHSRVLESAKVRALWKSPLLRYSRAIEGVFHRAVIVAEAESDVQFYSAVAAAAPRQALSFDQLQTEDVHFVHSNGKARLDVVVSAMRALGVPVQAVADIDVFDDMNVLGKILQAFDPGVDLEDISASRKTVDLAARDVGEVPMRRRLLADLRSILSARPNSLVSEKDFERVAALAYPASGWRRVKRAGVSALPTGDITKSARALVARVASVGLTVVEIGEVESFVPTISGHGTPWAISVLETENLADNREAVDFVHSIFARLEAQMAEVRGL